MMRMTVLASGSKGNSTVIASSRTRVLVDAGLSCRLKIPVFFTEPPHRAWVRMLTPRTTMTYAKWLDHVQREKEARAASIAASTSTAGLAAQLAAQAEAIASISAEAAVLSRSDDPNAPLELPIDPDDGELCDPELE